jgi:hypothetical protein
VIADAGEVFSRCLVLPQLFSSVASNALFLQQLGAIMESTASLHALCSPNKETRPDGPTEQDIMKRLEFKKTLDGYNLTLQGAQGNATKNAMKDFVTKIDMKAGATDLANEKLRGWQTKMVVFMETFGKNAKEEPKKLHETIQLALTSLRELEFLMRQIAPYLPSEDKDGQDIFNGAMTIVDGAGSANSLKALETLVGTGMTKLKVSNAMATGLGDATKAWVRLGVYSQSQRLNLFKKVCPTASMDDVNEVDQFMAAKLDTWMRASKQIEETYLKLVNPLIEEVTKFIDSAFDKDEDEFLQAFGQKTLKAMTPHYEKLTSHANWFREVNKHFGEIYNLEKHEGIITKAKVLSVKWAIFTVFQRLSGLEPDRRELILQISKKHGRIKNEAARNQH